MGRWANRKIFICLLHPQFRGLYNDISFPLLSVTVSGAFCNLSGPSRSSQHEIRILHSTPKGADFWPQCLNMNGHTFCDNPFKLKKKMSGSSHVSGSKGFIHVRTQSLAGTPNCGYTLQTRWDSSWRRMVSFLMVTIKRLLPSFITQETLKRFKFDLVGFSRTIARDSSSSCLRQLRCCWYSGCQPATIRREFDAAGMPFQKTKLTIGRRVVEAFVFQKTKLERHATHISCNEREEASYYPSLYDWVAETKRENLYSEDIGQDAVTLLSYFGKHIVTLATMDSQQSISINADA